MTSHIDPSLMGEAWPAARPYEDPKVYGTAVLSPLGEFTVRSWQTFTLTYTAGPYGVDDSGAIRVSFRLVGDWGRLQTGDPKAPNYVSAHTSGAASLQLEFRTYGMSPRPRNKSLTVEVTGGYLKEGDTISIVFGDTSQGSPGFKLQTFAEPAFEFKVSVDICATGHFEPLSKPLEIAIAPDEPSRWKAVLPTLRRPGQEFRLGLKAEDVWGNPTPKASGRYKLESDLEVQGLPEEIEYERGQRSMILEGLKAPGEGVLRIKLLDESGRLLAESNPMKVEAGEHAGYWGDLHGQSGESVGVGKSEDYFRFARDMAFLDVTSHQANDFQVNQAFWAHLNQLTRDFQDDGRFVVFPGYEWSGNTGVGGDRNIFYKNEGEQIHRSSHALIADRSDIASDAPDGQKLFKNLADKDCVTYAHVGGRYPDVDFAHDGTIETAMEIHSAWGSFEWLMADCFALGHRVGVVCNSDDHKGRPGASYPGASTFGAYGGLTCFLAEDLTRESIFECLRRRHHYGTSGARLHLEVSARFSNPARIFRRDPKLFKDPESWQSFEAMMGDIVQSNDHSVMLRLAFEAASGIERIEIRNGSQTLHTIKPYGPDDLGSRIRVIWSGAEYRGRSRDVRWQGRAQFSRAVINKWQAINNWNPERKFESSGDGTLQWDAITTGNFGGFDAWLTESPGAKLAIETNQGSLNCELAELGMQESMLDAGGLQKSLRVFRLPQESLPRRYETECEISLKPSGDNPLWISCILEDGSQAWSSPIYIFA
jgi:hypothetical protein